MITEAAFLAVDVWAPIVRTMVLLTFGPLILPFWIVSGSGGTVLELVLLLLLLLRVLTEEGFTEVRPGSEGRQIRNT